MHVHSFEDWKPVEYEEHSTLREVLGLLDTPRFGIILHAWDSDVGVIEHWCLAFEAPFHEEDDWYYRYLGSESGAGLIYRTLKDALEARGGQPINQALSNALADGLLLPNESETLCGALADTQWRLHRSQKTRR
jgi:hypothetical protein